MFQTEIRLVPSIKKQSDALLVTWCFPSSYSIGMSGLGFQLIWWLMEQDPSISVKRSFSDIFESGCEQGELFGFTVSWELDFIEVLRQLERFGIPWLSADRKNDERLVFAGGPVLTANPEPYADFFDVILLGDAEVTVPRFMQEYRQLSGKTRAEKLRALGSVPGIYVPSLYQCHYESAGGPLLSVTPIEDSVPARVTKEVYRAPDDYVAHSLLLSKEASWGDVFLVEIVRSCPQECRFCLASFLTRPFRSASIDTVLGKIDLALPHTQKVGLMGPSITEHPQFGELVERLMQRDLNVSIASVRADTLDRTLVENLVSLGQKSVTIAIESGSERLRGIMKKNLSNQEIENAVESAETGGLEAIKFYGMVGMPWEIEEDLTETVTLLTRLKKKYRKLRYTLGVSSFVPKAQTPFQLMGRDRSSGKKIEHLRKNFAKLGIEVRPESHNWSDIQALLSRGDRRLTPVLIEIARTAGRLGDWKKALKRNQENLPALDYYVFRDIPQDECLPWAHITPEDKVTYLTRHLNEAAALSEIPSGQSTS